MNFQSQKQRVIAFYERLDACHAAGDADEVAECLAPHCAETYQWRGMHPFNEIHGLEAVATEFWAPLKQSFSRIQRRMDIFFAGQNETDEFSSIWVASMGHLMALFDQEWLGIPPTRKLVMLRYAEFHRIEEDRIVETALFFDIPHLMMQAGINPFPPQTAAHLVQPGPLTHDGLLFDAQTEEEGKKTLHSINAMISDLGQWDLGLPLEEELARTWVDDMLWWGPAGIGATYTIERYAKQHSGPFRAAFKERTKTRHLCRMSEGTYGGFFGWPNFTAIPSGGFMGMPATQKPGEFRVVDIYRRAGDKLAENWIFIDMLHFWKTQGLDVLARLKQG